jgi:hypothetical protein
MVAEKEVSYKTMSKSSKSMKKEYYESRKWKYFSTPTYWFLY